MRVNDSEQSRSRVQVLAAKLYREHRGQLVSIAHRNGASHADAEDVLSESLANFIRGYDPDGGAPPLASLMLAVKRAAWAAYRRQHLDRSAAQQSTPDSAAPGFSIDRVAPEASDAQEAIERAEWMSTRGSDSRS